MVDFIRNGEVGITGPMSRFGDVIGRADARAQDRWVNQETRTEYDRAARQARAESLRRMEFQKANQGVFDDQSQMLAGLRPANVAPATANGAAPVTVGLPVEAAATASKDLKTTMPATESRMQGSNEPAFNVTQVTNTDLMHLNPTQRSAYVAYLRATRTDPYAPRWQGRLGTSTLRNDINPQEEAAARARMQAAGIDFRNGQLVFTSGNYSPQALQWDNNAPLNPGAPTTGGLIDSGASAAPTGTAAPQVGIEGPTTPGAPTALDAYAQRPGDTSAALQPTREMQLLTTQIQDALGQAQTAAQYGDTATSQAAYAVALQGQAQLVAASNSLLYGAAADGSYDAAATLLELTRGYAPGTARLQPTNEANPRFNLQINTAAPGESESWVTASAAPIAYEQVLGILQNLTDREGAAARTEANSAELRARIAAGAQIAVATIQQQTAFARNNADVIIEQLGNQTLMALEQGEAELRIDSANGTAYVTRRVPDENGNLTDEVGVIRMERQQAADARGRGQEIDVPTYSRVATGIPNVGANQ